MSVPPEARLCNCDGSRTIKATIGVACLLLSCSASFGQSYDNGISSALLAKAQSGDAEAMAELGYVYENTSGGVHDRAKAVYWYRKSAEAGNPDGEEGWAAICEYDFDDLDHHRQAAIWFRKAADQGNVSAQKDLAAAYEEGDGVPQDYAQAAQWYSRAANQGDPFAEYRLGELYFGGAGVPLDSEKGMKWLRLAAANGDLNAQAAVAEEEQTQAFLAEVVTEHRARQTRSIRLVAMAALIGFGLFVLVHQRRRVLRLCRTAVPKSTRAKQLSIILPVACWCSTCCLFEVMNPVSMRHPVNAAITAILLSAPAIIFGAVGLWWLSSGRKQPRERPDRIV
jgi:hypothetical protein